MTMAASTEYEYNPHVHVPDVARYVEDAAEASRMVRKRVTGVYDVAYGERPLMTCDIFPAGPDAPVHAFFHGGYWRGRDKADYSFMAPVFQDAGVTLVLPNYSLCPEVDLETIVADTASFFHWLAKNIRGHGGNPDRITASGHSAGAHLVAMAHAADRADAPPPGLVRKAVLISGLYDLRPVVDTTVNADIGLTDTTARRLSPIRHLPHRSLELSLYVGGGETQSWIAQSRGFLAVLQRAGYAASLDVLGNHNHYSIAAELGNGQSPLARACVDAARSV
ncbi:alpha/beta hydrolase [Aquisalimonas sp. 2447]|uniref:alpha/beta hydrolase n=1 Tax=Aquisalimonas sp. 2447 TaxID=2740807 RepID=UPI001432804C|nr:alpha/beta hydrolase [Aquisalimonas sp. 2447]QIT56962.1 alpha/beta hydrolase [Aquisalimonas sp. 2447]